MKKLTVGSCFSGIGGLELGLEWTGGFETKWQIEIDPYATKVLEKHWPNVQRFTDITRVEHPPRVDVICGGFPCQDTSDAGKRIGLGGSRSGLWKEMFRIVRHIRPVYVVVENVPGLLHRGMGDVLADLASERFDAEWGVLSSCAVGATHTRQRVFIVAHASSDGSKRRATGSGEEAERRSHAKAPRYSGWGDPPRICRKSDGVPNRLDRTKCVGNSVDPRIAQKIGEMILKYEGA